MKKDLRTGYTTGACAAAAAKAATMLLLGAEVRKYGSTEEKKFLNVTSELPSFRVSEVEIPFPDGNRVKFKIHNSKLITQNSKLIAMASVIKDAGDDPDVTNGAEIVAEVKLIGAGVNLHLIPPASLREAGRACPLPLIIKGGEGVGIVTKPGLPVPVGEPAINPVPRRMIREVVTEAIIQNTEHRTQNTDKNNLGSGLWILDSGLEITISVPRGKELAKKTLNPRLGIVGGISILGTTGIVEPLSSEAWTAAITASMDVVKAMGYDEIVLSAGRTSEKAHMKKYNLPEESYVMMGDYLEFSLLEAKKHGFRKIHLCAQWAKMLKIAMATPHTHVKHGATDIRKTLEFLKKLEQGVKVKEQESWLMGQEFNTAREIFDFINSKLNPELDSGQNSKLFSEVCSTAKKYAEGITGEIPVTTYLVSYKGEIISSS